MLSDIGIFFSRGFSPLLVVFFLAVRFILKGASVRITFLTYFVCLGMIFSLNPYGTSLLLITPIIAYIFCVTQSVHLWRPDEFDGSIKVITFFILIVCVVEFFVKLSLVNLEFYKSFIIKYGDMRFDVLRSRSIFASSLGTASVAIALTFYWSIISPSISLFLLAFLISLLSGSRTSFVIIMLLLVVSKISPLYLDTVRQLSRKILAIFLTFVLLISASQFFPESNVIAIVQRSFRIVMDASFTGRAGTSGATTSALFGDLPESLIWGLQGQTWISDSTFTSIAAKSGVLSLIFFLGLIFSLLIESRLSMKNKIVFSAMCALGASMIGDFFVPSVLFLYVVFFLRLRANSRFGERNELVNSNNATDRLDF